MKDFVIGLKELDAALKELPNSMAKQTLSAAIKKSGGPIVDAARQNAISFTHPGTYARGDLSRSIIISPRRNKRQRRKFKELPGNAVQYIGPSYSPGDPNYAPYAHLKEFGSSKQQPEPFLRPAWDLYQSLYLDAFKKEAWKAIERARKRLVKKAVKVAVSQGFS